MSSLRSRVLKLKQIVDDVINESDPEHEDYREDSDSGDAALKLIDSSRELLMPVLDDVLELLNKTAIPDPRCNECSGTGRYHRDDPDGTTNEYHCDCGA